MRNYIFLITLFTGLILPAQQQLTGKVYDKNKIALEGVTVYWLNTQVGTTTNELGEFSINYKPDYKKLVLSYIGFKTDTITVKDTEPIIHYLTQDNELDEIKIVSKKQATQKSFLETTNVFTVNSAELLKAACCNLAESFETNPSIDVHFSDALTGTKQIQMLGLKSPYLLITQENIPAIRGASQVFGMTFTPGTWVESIQITKGAGSVINGYESISGQINTELVKPLTDNRFFLNSYANLSGRLELNTHINKKLSERWQTGIYIHGNLRDQKNDMNNDGFLDMPLMNQINVLNRWQYVNPEKGWISFINFRFMNDEKQTGQLSFDPDIHRGTSTFWGSEIDTRRFDLSSKIGYVFPELPFQSFGFQFAYSNHEQDSYFGLRSYEIEHQSFYSNFLFNSIIGDTRNKFTTGLSFTHDQYNELVNLTSFARTENSVGTFFEYSYDNLDDISLQAGIRLDHHNLLGTFVTPRLHLRWVPWGKSAIRFSVGQGRKSANIFAENQQLFASARQISIQNSGGSIYGLDPEIAVNYGVSWLQGFNLFEQKGNISFDFYRTEFQNQVVVDWENPREISFYNLPGESTANSFQVELNYDLKENLTTRIAYKYYDIQIDYNQGRLSKPLIPEHRFFANLSYETTAKDNGSQWKWHATYNYLGEQRLPNTASNSIPNQLENFANGYSLLNSQVTRVFSDKFEMYLGGENLTNVQQENPILATDNPFGSEFDSTIIFAPIFGRMFYLGLRFKLN